MEKRSQVKLYMLMKLLLVMTIRLAVISQVIRVKVQVTATIVKMTSASELGATMEAR